MQTYEEKYKIAMDSDNILSVKEILTSLDKYPQRVKVQLDILQDGLTCMKKNVYKVIALPGGLNLSKDLLADIANLEKQIEKCAGLIEN